MWVWCIFWRFVGKGKVGVSVRNEGKLGERREFELEGILIYFFRRRCLLKILYCFV